MILVFKYSLVRTFSSSVIITICLQMEKYGPLNALNVIDWINSGSVVRANSFRTKTPTGGGKSQCQSVKSKVLITQYSSQTWTPCLEHSRKFAASLPADINERIDLWNGTPSLSSHPPITYTAPCILVHMHSKRTWIPASSKWHFLCWAGENRLRFVYVAETHFRLYLTCTSASCVCLLRQQRDNQHYLAPKSGREEDQWPSRTII